MASPIYNGFIRFNTYQVTTSTGDFLLLSWYIFLNTGYVLADVFTIDSEGKLKLYCKRKTCLSPYYNHVLTMFLVVEMLFYCPCNYIEVVIW